MRASEIFSGILIALAVFSFLPPLPALADRGWPAMPKDPAQLQNFIDKTLQSGFEKNRTDSFAYIRDLTVFYGDDLKGRTPECYRAALSDFIEKEHARVMKETGCDSTNKPCTKAGSATPNTASENSAMGDNALRGVICQINDYLLPPERRYAFTAEKKALYPCTTPVSLSQTSLQQKADEINHELENCASIKPLGWSVPASSDVTDPVLTRNTKIETYVQLAAALIGSEAAPDKAGYAQCLYSLHIFLRSSQPPPALSKEKLTATLEDLKAHQCTPSYAGDLAMQIKHPDWHKTKQ